MNTASTDELLALLRCPRCHSELFSTSSERMHCTGGDCRFATERFFPVIDGQPVLIDFERSILDRGQVLASSAASPVTRDPGESGSRTGSSSRRPSTSPVETPSD